MSVLITGPRTGRIRARRPERTGREPSRSIDLPTDAREWVDACTLAFWVQEEVATLGTLWAASDASVPRESTADLFGLLTFAYATNVLSASEIAKACRQDAAFRFLAGGNFPFPAQIDAFRRRHRLELQNLLTQVWGRLLSTRYGSETPRLYPRLLEVARERLDTARHLDTDD